MNLDFTHEGNAFRAEVRAFVRENLPAHILGTGPRFRDAVEMSFGDTDIHLQQFIEASAHH